MNTPPSDQPQVRPITTEEIEFPERIPTPCWLFIPEGSAGIQDKDEWVHRGKPFTHRSVLSCTHWHPDQPSAPTVRPDEKPADLRAIAAAHLWNALRCPAELCPRLVNNGVNSLAAMIGITDDDLIEMGFTEIEAETLMRCFQATPEGRPMPKPTPAPVSAERGSENWVPLADVVEVLRHPNFYWGSMGGLTSLKYMELRIDTRDNKCVVRDRDGKPVSMERIRESLANPIRPDMNQNTPHPRETMGKGATAIIEDFLVSGLGYVKGGVAPKILAVKLAKLLPSATTTLPSSASLPESAVEKCAEEQANNLHAVLMGAHGLITMCRDHFLERELAACDGNSLYAPECLTAILKINQADKDFARFKSLAKGRHLVRPAMRETVRPQAIAAINAVGEGDTFPLPDKTTGGPVRPLPGCTFDTPPPKSATEKQEGAR